MTLTDYQKKRRRQARNCLKEILQCIRLNNVEMAYIWAKSAASVAFEAHPELRVKP